LWRDFSSVLHEGTESCAGIVEHTKHNVTSITHFTFALPTRDVS
jgi:hypothetical protein